ncbi:anti-sigma factor [Streptomyces calidiresistens]|uniref:Regulator of SigK n=1 Tax=Streptomyces calidiresistens TaxID=1485586 RepID=A0A7W3T805_9ACTN|nr:anti-sigma factor [Streptomyces calidiresistens]MBB0232652.1 anti-sigma factor [Streptomyces calidiresistens]
MNTADLHTLTGAYVLHALSPGERADFERHLAVCDACAVEVAELAATAGRLAGAVAVAPPPGMRAEVLRRIGTVRQEPPVVPAGDRPGTGRFRGRGGRAPRWVVAACLVAALVGGAAAVWQHREADLARERAVEAERLLEAGEGMSEVLAVLAAPDALAVSGELVAGATGTVVVSAAEDRAVFVSSGMPPAPEGMTYQLWFDDAGTMRPAGLMEPAGEPGTSALVMEGPLAGAVGMGITLEPAGGSPRPTSEPLAAMAFPVPGGGTG